MSVFLKAHTLINEGNSIGAFENETELQCQFVNLSLGQLCPVTIIYPTSTGEYKRIETLRAREFAVCNYPRNNEPLPIDCNDLCVNITKCFERITCGDKRDCLTEVIPREEYSFKIDHDYEYLSFTCPISRLIKFAFPIIINQHLICVVFIGQFKIFFRGRTHPLTKSRVKKGFESKKKLYQYISEFILPEILQFQGNTEKNFEDKERKALNSLLTQAEEKLSKSMIEVLNYNVDSDLEDYSTAVLKQFWSGVSQSYSILFSEMGAQKVTIFIDDDFSDNFSPSKKISGIDIFSISGLFQYRTNQPSFFDVLKADAICEELNSDIISSTMPLIRKDLQDCFHTFLPDSIYQYDYVFYKNDTHLPYAIMIFHTNSNGDLSKTIVDLIRKIATNIRFELSSVLRKLSEHATKAILRIYRHEIVHQVLALRTSINNLDPENKEYISPEKVINIFKDCSDCLSALSFMTENIKLFTSHSTPIIYSVVQSSPYETIDIFKDVIYKHFAMHRELRDSKSLWFEATGRTEVSQKLECQPRFLNLVLFNIISNAVKYAYRRTNIWFIYSISEEKHDTKILTIRNFGPEVPAGDEIYRLYYRGHASECAETGSGIGLFISKRISEIMGVKLWHQCRRISDYNVSLMERYLEICYECEGAYKKIAPSAEDIMKEITRLQSNNIYYQIVNSHQQKELNLCNDEIVSKISRPTYEVSFILEL